jgi:hypothetical protein
MRLTPPTLPKKSGGTLKQGLRFSEFFPTNFMTYRQPHPSPSHDLRFHGLY